MLLGLAAGQTLAAVGATVGVSANTVAIWRDRYLETGLDGLANRPRNGRPPTDSRVDFEDHNRRSSQFDRYNNKSGSLARAKDPGRAPGTATPAIPSNSLQAGLAKQSGLSSRSKPNFQIWPGPLRSADETTSDAHGPTPANRILNKLAELLEKTEDTVSYLRVNLGRMPDNKADAVARAESEEGKRLRCALEEQLVADTSRADLVTAIIAKRARFCAAIGGLFAMPGTMPGVGTVAQFVLGMAATWPEMDLIRYQMWCLQIEVLHLYGMTYSEVDAELLGAGTLDYEWVNKGGEVLAQNLGSLLPQSPSTATKILNRFLVKIGVSAAWKEPARQILAKTLPLGIGVAVGATVNSFTLHRFARRQRRSMQITAD